MDPVTHAVFAVCCTVAITRIPERRRKAAIAGLSGGLWPDADIFLKSAEDPLFALEYHRHFTHSFAFSPVMMLIAASTAWLLLWVFRKRTPLRQLLWPALIAVWSHIFCDLWTSYGTRVFWPFSQDRPGFDWISVIDPLMTIPLLGCAAAAAFWSKRRAAFAGLAWVGIYLGLCLVQKHRAETALDAIIAARSHHPERINVKPTFGNIVLWRGIYEAEGTYYAVAIRPGWPGDVKVKAGETAAVLPGPAGDGSPWEGIRGDSTVVLDAARFYHFSGNWVGWHPDFPGTVLGDLRYARLPGEFSPMWGIGFDRTDPERHVPWMTFRTLSRESLAPLWEMICGGGF